MLMIRPPPWRIITRPTACAHRKAPLRSMASTSSQRASVIPTAGPRGEQMAGDTVPGVRAKLARGAKRGARKIVGASALTPGIDSTQAARAAMRVVTDPSRDALLTNFGRATLQDRYLLPGESIQD